ncbi:hypothetical protein LguiB_022825 [Lonicera macranthoides]
MAHHPTHRRNLASSDPNPMDPTSKKHPSFTTTTAGGCSTTKPYPKHPDPNTIQNISNKFSKLHTHHKLLASLKPSNRQHHPQQDTYFQAKTMSISTISDGSSTSLTKSKSLCRRNLSDLERVKEKPKKPLKKVSHEEQDIKREITEEIKKISKKTEREKKECDEIKRSPVSVAMVAGTGRRRSFGCTETELGDFFSRNGVKVVSVDMPPFMQIHAVDFARKACDSLEKFTARTLASTLKKEFDGVYGPAWHCIVGTSFGSFVTHSVGGFLYFSMDHKLYVLLFKTTVQRAQD